MEIKSNTFGKLMKIKEGTVFSNEYMFVKEFLQNAQRGKTKELYITVTENFIRFKDNGIGCKNPNSVFTLDKSEWSTTDEGFGIGFWACLAFKKLESIEVSSRKWKAFLDVNNLFLNEDLTVKKEDLEESVKGFDIVLNCSTLSNLEISEINEQIYEVAKYLNFDIYLNGDLIEKIDIFENVSGDFVKEIDNRFFKARLSIEEYRYNNLEIFYDRRSVGSLYRFDYVSGVIEPKRGKLTLKEPDRTEYVRDYKYYDFEEILKKEIKNMYMDFLKSNPCDTILTKYSEAIDEYLEVKEYSKFLVLDDEFNIDNLNKKESVQENPKSIMKPAINIQREEISYVGISTKESECIKSESVENESQITLGEFFYNNISDSSKEIVSDEDILNCDEEVLTLSYNDDKEIDYSDEEIYEEDNIEENTVFDKDSFSINDYKVIQAPLNLLEEGSKSKDVYSSNKISKKQNENSFVSFIKKTKNIVWVLKEDVDDYSDEISLAKYCNLIVYKAKNILEANTLKEYGKLHINDLKESLIETYDTKNIGLKNKKEEAFVKLLMPVCKKYGLHMNIFSIANLSCKTELKINDKVIYRKNEKNSKKIIYTKAIRSGENILFDRNYLNLSRFSIKAGVFGSNEISLLMFVLKTVAHELAHYLYNTVDNTLYHYQKEDEIYNELIDMYILNKDYVAETIKKYA